MTKLEDLAFKFVLEDGKAPMGRGYWKLPKNGKPGAWKRKLIVDDYHELHMCKHGYHMCRWNQLSSWDRPARRLFIAEYRGEILDTGHDDKFCVQQGRLLKELVVPCPGIAFYNNKPYKSYEYRNADKRSRKRIIRKWLKANGVDVDPIK